MRAFLFAGSAVLIFGLVILIGASRGGIGSDIGMILGAFMALIGAGLVLLSVYYMTTKKKGIIDKI